VLVLAWVPFTRGPEAQARASDSILKEVRQLAELGYSEVQLLGQTVNSYADPTSRGMRFFRNCCWPVAEVQGIRRVRFTTSHPSEFTPDNCGSDRAGAESVRPTCTCRYSPGSTRVLRGDAAYLFARRVSGKRLP